ncbi:MAG TPA: amidohydrolase family protein [Gemmataceae bacterium]|jgi:predicted TIM-barrel fold metal-dependent hydrolase|nr:amidohydrolase family protein [Gemmataceae bacterium]
MNRREFLSAAGATVAAGALAKDETKMIPIVDCHQHLWDLSKLKLAWVKEGEPLAHSFTPKEYAEASQGLNIAKCVYMEVDVVEADQQKEVDYLIELIKSKSSPTVAAVVGGRPNKGDEFKKYVAQFKGSPYIKGLRQVVHTEHTPPGYSTTKEFIAGVRHLGEIGLSWDICQRPADLGDADKLVSECPDTRFILDHCGNAPILDAKKMEQWKKDIAKVAARKNVMGKVSGIIASVKKGDWSIDQLAPAVNHTIEVFGWDRVMWAGDWPVCTLGAPLKDWVAAAKKIVQDKSEEQQRKLFHDNAVKFYGL